MSSSSSSSPSSEGPSIANLVISGVMLLGALLVNGPTILQCIKNSSTAGISFSAQRFEFYTAIFSLAYSYQTLTIDKYIEGICGFLQTCTIIALIWTYEKLTLFLILPNLVGFITVAAVCFQFPFILDTLKITKNVEGLVDATVGCPAESKFPCSIEILTTISCIFLISARSTQIFANIKAGGMGNQSITTPIMLLAGSAMRIFTLATDKVIVWGALFPYLISTVLSLISLAQFAVYSSKSAPTTATAGTAKVETTILSKDSGAASKRNVNAAK